MDAAWAGLLPPCAQCRTAPVADAGQPLPLAHGSRGEPLWPGGTVGSVTHADGYRTVATAPAGQLAALGIDMEPLAPLPPALWPHFLDAEELAALAHRPAPQRGYTALSAWCVKEALFKALGGRLAFDALPLCDAGEAWHPAPALRARLRDLGCDPDRLTLRALSEGGWLRAAAWSR